MCRDNTHRFRSTGFPFGGILFCKLTGLSHHFNDFIHILEGDHLLGLTQLFLQELGNDVGFWSSEGLFLWVHCQEGLLQSLSLLDIGFDRSDQDFGLYVNRYFIQIIADPHKGFLVFGKNGAFHHGG